MSELTTVARPYAKAAFDFAVEHNTVAQWQDMLVFAGQVAQNNEMHQQHGRSHGMRSCGRNGMQ